MAEDRTKPNPFPDVLDMRQVAAKLGKSHSWLKEYIRENPFGRKVGAKRVFTPGDYAALLNSFPVAEALEPALPRGRKARIFAKSSTSGERAYEELMARLSAPKPRRSRLSD